jgi:hypothetical protein
MGHDHPGPDRQQPDGEGRGSTFAGKTSASPGACIYPLTDAGPPAQITVSGTGLLKDDGLN